MNVIYKKRKYSLFLQHNMISFFFKFLIFFSFIKRNLNVSFHYPKALTLITGNIFIIHETGVDIYDSTLQHLVKNVLTFSGTEKIGYSTISKIAISRFNDDDYGLIICIINDKIYVFNYNGELIYIESNRTVLNKINSENVYSLNPIKKNQTTYSYMISYIDAQNNINQFFFEYNNDTKSNILKNEYNSYRPDFSSSINILNNEITCQLMSSSIENEIIVCFFMIGYPRMFTQIFIDPNNYKYINKSVNNLEIKIENNYKRIKSVSTANKKKSLVCSHYSNGNGTCTIYSIDDYSFTNLKEYGNNCAEMDFRSSLEYIRETDQFIYFCTKEDGQITATIFNGDFSNYTNCFIAQGYTVNSASIIYSYTLKNYYVISDILTNDGNQTFIPISSSTILPKVSIIGQYTPTTILKTTILSKTTIPQTTITTTVPETTLVKPTTNIFKTTVVTSTIFTKTTIPTTIVQTTIPSTTTPTTIVSTTVPSTVIEKTTIISFICPLEKCESCDKLSFAKNLCIKCNKNQLYYQIDSSLLDPNSNYVDCFNNFTKPKNFYFNPSTEYYELCYESCASCEYGGDGNQNNCTTCDVDLILEPEKNSKNCVALCTYFYYYNSYNQYKCTTTAQCPDDYNYLVRRKGKCIDNCENDSTYKYQYNGECYEHCPNDTISDGYTCKIMDVENCTLSSNELFDKESIYKVVKTYVKEFSNTNKHISLYKNDNYSIMIYKNKECIKELHLPMEVDLGDCYKNVQSHYYGNEGRDLIVEIVEKKNKNNQISNKNTFFFDPEYGEKLEIDNICPESVIKVKENLKTILNGSVDDFESILYLTNQNINVFNKSSEFYTDLCYHFDSPCDKDIAIKDRLLAFYPNISLCDSSCTNVGINLTEMSVICECKYKDFLKDNSDEEDNIYTDVVNTVSDIFNEVNLVVMGCYKDLFEYDYFSSNTGGITLLILNAVQMIILMIYYFSSSFNINKYIYNVTDNYILYLNQSPLVNNKIFSFKDGSKEVKNCPLRKRNLIDDNLNNLNNSSETKKIHKKRSKAIKILDDSNNKLNSSKSKKLKIIKKMKPYFSKKLRKIIALKASTINLQGKGKNEIESYLSTDFNDMNFHDVALTDKRLFFDYFCDKLKKKQVILELFYINSPLKPITIKLLLVILDIEICFVTNALFINENYISDLFHSKKEENFISFFPRSITRSIYSIIIVVIVSYFIRCLFTDESKIKGILKREKNDITNMKFQINLIMKEIKTRYNIFILAATIFSIFSWFYISCFNNIYPHVKIEWIKSSITIIILIHFLSFLLILVETLLRFVSFEIKSEKMYKASMWLG